MTTSQTHRDPIKHPLDPARMRSQTRPGAATRRLSSPIRRRLTAAALTTIGLFTAMPAISATLTPMTRLTHEVVGQSDTLRTHRWDRDRTHDRIQFPVHPERLGLANRFGSTMVSNRLGQRIRQAVRAHREDSLFLQRMYQMQQRRGGAGAGISGAGGTMSGWAKAACGTGSSTLGADEVSKKGATGLTSGMTRGQEVTDGTPKGWFNFDESTITKIDIQEPDGQGGWQSMSRVQFMRNEDGLPSCVIERSPDPENRMQFSTSYSYNANGDLRQTQLHLSDDESDVLFYDFEISYDELGRPALIRDILYPVFMSAEPDTFLTTFTWGEAITALSISDGVDGTPDSDTLRMTFTEGGSLQYELYESYLDPDSPTYELQRTRIWERRRFLLMQRVRDLISGMYHFYDFSPVEVEQAASEDAPYQNRERIRHRNTFRRLLVEYDKWAQGGYWSTVEQITLDYLENDEPGWLLFEELAGPDTYQRHVINDAQVTSNDVVQGPPAGFRLEANYPNPFNPTTILPFTLEEAAHVRLDVLDELGRPIARVLDGPLQAGSHRVEFDAQDYRLPGGVYLYRLTVDGREASRSMVLVK